MDKTKTMSKKRIKFCELTRTTELSDNVLRVNYDEQSV